MKKFTYIIFSCLFISCAQSDVKPVDETIERLAKDFTSHLAGDWEEYSVTRYFSRSDSKFSFLASNFGEEVVNQASRIEEARLNVKEKGDVEGATISEF